MWDARIDDPFGRPTRMPLDVEYLLVHGVVGPIKWLVQPELTMVRVLGTKLGGKVSSRSQLVLCLVDPPFVSAFVAPLSFLGIDFLQSWLEFPEE